MHRLRWVVRGLAGPSGPLGSRGRAAQSAAQLWGSRATRRMDQACCLCPGRIGLGTCCGDLAGRPAPGGGGVEGGAETPPRPAFSAAPLSSVRHQERPL